MRTGSPALTCKINTMNTYIFKCSVVIAALIVTACEDDPITEHNNNGTETTVAFESAARTVAENADEQTVTIVFSKPLPHNALLTLKGDNKFAEYFATVPAITEGLIKIELLKGATNATLTLVPLDNSQRDGTRVGSLTVSNLSVPYRPGTHSAINITVTDDESDAAAESVANFIEQSLTIDETATSWIEYQVHFSEAVATDSKVKISISSEKGTYGVDFVTEPAAHEDTVTLNVTSGSRVVNFRVRPVDNNKITGDLAVNFSISETTGSVRKGTKLHEVLTVKDDELAGKPKGYEISAGNWSAQRFYEYDEHGRVAKVLWRNYTPFLTEGTEVYHYDANSQLVKVVKYPGREVMYQWLNGRITRSETIWHGTVHDYSEFAYDDEGNVGGVVTYHRQPDGSFKKGLYTIYLYFTDGNLYKSLTYQDSDDPENPYLVSTRTYDNYLEVENLFPMAEVLPNVKMQKTLPTTYRAEEAGHDLLYNITYEFREDGRPGKRIARAGAQVETAVYHYY